MVTLEVPSRIPHQSGHSILQAYPITTECRGKTSAAPQMLAIALAVVASGNPCQAEARET